MPLESSILKPNAENRRQLANGQTAWKKMTPEHRREFIHFIVVNRFEIADAGHEGTLTNAIVRTLKG